jgi:chemotaxis signal transduction protein
VTDVHVRMKVGDEHYALPVAHVLEVADLGEVTPVPGAPAAFLGVRNLRGQVLPVVDLATLLGIAQSTKARRLVVAEDDGRSVGLAIDDVTDVGVLPGARQEAEAKLVTGAVLADDTLVGVLDVDGVFAALEPRSGR